MTSTVSKERKAWEEVEKRLAFLVEVVGNSDVTMSRMAAKKLAKALEAHAPAYEKRMKFEFDKKRKKN